MDGVRTALLDWYGEAGRTLPWRADRDAYRILVSEFMLVQTTVAAVIPYFETVPAPVPGCRDRWPRRTKADVLKAWEGLGYYRRARQLQAAARQVVRMHGGTIPDDPAAVRALPGVGPYIAGAVLSFAFDRPEPIVEANSQRVLARLIALRDDLKSTAARRRVWLAAGRLVPPRRAGDFNQALMDLGAMVCTPRQPSCLFCPLAAICRARRLGLQDVIPRTTPKPPPTAVSEACAVVAPPGPDPDRPARAGAALGAVLGVPDDPRRRPGSRRDGRSAPRSSWPRASDASPGSPPRSARRRPRSDTESPTTGSRWRSAGARPDRARPSRAPA